MPPSSSTVKVEATYSSGTSIDFQTTQRHILEVWTLFRYSVMWIKLIFSPSRAHKIPTSQLLVEILNKTAFLNQWKPGNALLKNSRPIRIINCPLRTFPYTILWQVLHMRCWKLIWNFVAYESIWCHVMFSIRLVFSSPNQKSKDWNIRDCDFTFRFICFWKLIRLSKEKRGTGRKGYTCIEAHWEQSVKENIWT
jgi:hypothetical protein